MAGVDPSVLMTSGLLYVDKPAGVTSHDVVSVVRRAARTKRVGHAGTLDPFATGLLVLAINSTTRLLPYVDGEPKVYEALIRFGYETDTEDATGTKTTEASVPSAETLASPAMGALAAAIRGLTGAVSQVPPAYSAKHVDGERAYVKARRGDDVQLAPVNVTVWEWEWLASTASSLSVRIRCGGGTYIRSLARDLGRALGSAAHCESLRRVASGAASVAEAVTLGQLDPGSIAEGRVLLRSPVPALGAMAHQHLDEDGLTALRYGRRVAATVPGARVAMLVGGTVVAIGERVADTWWQPRVVMLDAAGER